jgi:hypothetical protein
MTFSKELNNPKENRLGFLGPNNFNSFLNKKNSIYAIDFMHSIIEGLFPFILEKSLTPTQDAFLMNLLKKQHLLIDFSRNFNYNSITKLHSNMMLNILLYYNDLFNYLNLHNIHSNLICLLSQITQIIVRKELSVDLLKILDSKIKIFLKLFKKEFKEIKCTFNFHNMRHFTKSICNHGSMGYINW